MIVNLDGEDRTWVVHFEGAMAILRNDRGPGGAGDHEQFLFCQALHINDQERCSETPLDPNKTFLLPEVLKLRLYRAALDLETLTSSKEQPRKIDIQALRLRLKRLLTDLQIVSSVDALREAHPNVEHWILQIIASELIMECGTLLHIANEHYHTTYEAIELSAAIRESAESMRHALAPQLLTLSSERADIPEEDNGPSGGIDLETIRMLWPLSVVHTARAASESTRAWAREALWRIGGVAHIPKAFQLAQMTRAEVRYSESVAGLMLVAFARESCGNANVVMS